MSYKIAVNVKGLIVRGKRILLIKRAAHRNAAGHWELPGGGLKFGESPNAVAAREVLEETALLVRPKFVTTVRSWVWTNADLPVHGLDVVYHMEEVAALQDVILSDKHEEYNWFFAEELSELVMHDGSHAAIARSLQQLWQAREELIV